MTVAILFALVAGAVLQDKDAPAAFDYNITLDNDVAPDFTDLDAFLRSITHIQVTCAARKGWGLLLSEIQVFDTVAVDKSVPPLVVLPPVRAGR